MLCIHSEKLLLFGIDLTINYVSISTEALSEKEEQSIPDSDKKCKAFLLTRYKRRQERIDLMILSSDLGRCTHSVLCF